MIFRKFIKTIVNVILPDRISYLVFFVTSRCNSRCRTCFFWKNIRNQNKKEIRLTQIKRTFKKTGFIPYVSLSGGEPFLREDMSELLNIIADNTDPIMINIPTNGSRYSYIGQVAEDFLKRHRHILLQIEVSLDGIANIHDHIRGRKGSYDEVMKTLVRLKRLRRVHKNLRIKINSTFNSMNKDSFEELVAFISGLDVDGFSYSYLMGDTKDNKSKTNINVPQIKENISTVKKYMKSKRDIFSLFLDIMQERSKDELVSLNRSGRYHHRCLAGKKIIVLREDSNLYLCEDFRLKLGNIRRFGFDLNSIYKNKKTRYLRNTLVKKHRCDCGWSCELLMYSVRQIPFSFFELFGKRG